MKKVCFMMALVALMGVTACGQNKGSKNVSTKSKPIAMVDTKQAADEHLLQDIGEMLLVGFRGTELKQDHHILRDIKAYHIGGVILFEYDAISGKHGRNIVSEKQLENLCSQLQKAGEEILFIGVDQEGGKVCRLGQKQGFPVIPSAQTMAKGGVDTVMRYSQITAKTLRRMGINLNFAPCVDVFNPECPVIGRLGRSFGEDPETIAKMASAWIEGHRKMQVMCCLKHFPGHGNSMGDTHHGLVDVTGMWKPDEMEPYRLLCERSKVDMVMTAHVVNKEWGDKLPASLNHKVNDMLRNEIKFDGLVITDDLSMGAITKEYDYKEVLRLAILAGADILCLSNNGERYNAELVPQTVRLISEMVADGSIDARMIHESAEKIRKYKTRLK